MSDEELNALTERIIGCAFKVANTFGCGFLEKVHENALVHYNPSGIESRQGAPRRFHRGVPELLESDRQAYLLAAEFWPAPARHQALSRSLMSFYQFIRVHLWLKARKRIKPASRNCKKYQDFGFNKYRFAILMPLIVEPTMPTKPWSVPQTNKFFKCVVPS